jgi:hypothetical protein
VSTQHQKCPSCGTTGIISGQKVSSTPPKLVDHMLEWEDVYLPVEFRCFCCDLRLMGHELLQGAELGGQFAVRQKADPVTYYSPAEEYFEEYNNM